MKSWGSDSSTHSHGVTHLGERERARAERTCPGTFPPPGLAGAALLTQGPGKGRGGGGEEEVAPPGQTTVVWGCCLPQPEGRQCSEGLNPQGRPG